MVIIGNFDGLHLGHRQLIRQARQLSSKHKAPILIYTFEPHPVKFLKPEAKLKEMFPLEDLFCEAERIGVDAVVVEAFDREFSQINAETFIAKILVQHFSPSTIIVGDNFRFGKSREGDVKMLKLELANRKVNVCVEPALLVGGEPVSSSRIRKLLEAGDVAGANLLLGRAFEVTGEVVHGAGRGRNLGIQTANIQPFNEMIPKRGVYATWFWIGEKRFASVTNIGTRPTFETSLNEVIETHILQKISEIYGERVRVTFEERLRDEIKFSSADELKRQIQLDTVQALKILGEA